jgi:hypothetical protein
MQQVKITNLLVKTLRKNFVVPEVVISLALYGTLRFITVFIRPHHFCVLSEMNPVHTLP